MSQPQPTDLPVLIAETVSKEFPNGVKALRDVSLRVERGETLVLIGASGCGKSTCLRLFNGMTVPTRGTVRVRGERVDAIPPVGLRRSVGYVQQNGGLIPHWTGRTFAEMSATEKHGLSHRGRALAAFSRWLDSVSETRS